MENTGILIDTSILIDYFRKRDKSKSILYQLSDRKLSVSVITEFEFTIGFPDEKLAETQNIFRNMNILELDSSCVYYARNIYQQLKSRNQLIEVPDILIAASALRYELPLATLNIKHFNRIPELSLEAF